MKSEPSITSEPVNGSPRRSIARSLVALGHSNPANRENLSNDGRFISRIMKPSASHIVIALATPAPTAPSAGAPQCPNMNTQLSSTFTGSAMTVISMIVRVRPSPSLVYVSTCSANIAGTAQQIACVYAVAVGMIGAAVPTAV